MKTFRFTQFEMYKACAYVKAESLDEAREIFESGNVPDDSWCMPEFVESLPFDEYPYTEEEVTSDAERGARIVNGRWEVDREDEDDSTDRFLTGTEDGPKE